MTFPKTIFEVNCLAFFLEACPLPPPVSVHQVGGSSLFSSFHQTDLSVRMHLDYLGNVFTHALLITLNGALEQST